MYELFEGVEESEDELVPRVKYSVILQTEEYEDDDDEEDPLPYVDIGPGYYFFDSEEFLDLFSPYKVKCPASYPLQQAPLPPPSPPVSSSRPPSHGWT